MRRALTRSGLAVVNAPFGNVCGIFFGRSKRFCAEDRGFLSEAGQFPFGKPLTGVARPKIFFRRPVCPDGRLHWYCKAGIVGDGAPRAVFLSLSSGPRCSASWLVWTRRLGLLVLTLSLARCSSWCLRPQMPVIMAGLDHRTVWRFTGAVLGQGFLHARCCATSVLVQTVLHTVWRFRTCFSSRSSFSCCGTEAYSMQTIVFSQLLRYMSVVFNNRCLMLDSVVLHRFRSFSSLVVFDISVVAVAVSYGPDCSDDH